MGVCRVAFADSEGILHSVEEEADSLYEAVYFASRFFSVFPHAPLIQPCCSRHTRAG
jgi:hypothetical protein